MVKWHEGMTWYGGVAQCKSSLRAVFHMSHVVIVAKSTCAKMLTWHGDVAGVSDMAQGKSSLRAVFHMFHVVIVAKSTCAKFVVVFEK